MIKFDLERALAGDKVITRDGRVVTGLVRFPKDSGSTLYGLDEDNDTVESWFDDGSYHNIQGECGGDLFMAPKKLSGFVVIYKDGVIGNKHSTRKFAELAVQNSIDRGCDCSAIIDLSQFDEGHGL